MAPPIVRKNYLLRLGLMMTELTSVRRLMGMVRFNFSLGLLDALGSPARV